LNQKDYHYDHDYNLNHLVHEEWKQTVELGKALRILKLDNSQKDKIMMEWGIGNNQYAVLVYAAG
jgi:hypothetical protein